MLQTLIEFTRYFCAALFGVAVAVGFAGMPRTWKNRLVTGLFTAALFALQLLCLRIRGLEAALKIYPLHTHLPVALFIALYLKRSLPVSLTCMFTSYLCCQPARWIGAVAGAVFGSATADHLGYILSLIPLYWILHTYVADSVRNLMARSAKSCLLFAAMPAFYYCFDFAASVYTDFLYSSSRAAVLLMPTVTSALYLLFVLLYYAETQKQARTERQRDMLETQYRLAQAEFQSLRQLQQNAAAYRHDMRHHFALLQGLAAEGRLEEIQDYVRNAQSDIDAITPIRFCENETVNLILSAYSAKAGQEGIGLSVEATLPDFLPFSDTDLCSLLSNALENAINACRQIPEGEKRLIRLRIFSKNSKLCIDIRNRYRTEPEIRNEVPVANRQGHGFGTKSMAHIVEKHGGVFQFSVQDGWFVFQATT